MIWSLLTVTPLSILSSAVDAVIPSNTLISSADAVTAVVPNIRDGVLTCDVASKFPVTLARPLDSVINPLSLEWPIVDPLITTSSISSDPPVICPVVVIAPVISILVNPFTIEPDDNAPTETISELPSFTP